MPPAASASVRTPPVRASARVARGLRPADLTALVRAVAADAPAWRSRLRIPGAGADRWWTRLSTSADVDVWLLSWLPGHRTELHDHGPSWAAFTVIAGELDEVRSTSAGRYARVTHPPGSVSCVAPGAIHDVTGGGTQPSVSIHAYSPPLTVMTYFDGGGHPVRTMRTHAPEQGSVA